MLNAIPLSLLLLLPAGAEADSRLPPPTGTQLETSEEEVRNLCPPPPAGAAAADWARLARKLLDLARGTEKDRGARYVLLRRAGEAAAQAGDLKTSLEAIALLAGEYQVTDLELRLAALEAAARSGEAKALPTLVEESREILGRALGAYDFEMAKKISALALAVGKNSASAWHKACLENLIQRQQRATRLQGLVAKALAVASIKPEDPKARLVLGRFSCLVAGDWKGGLPRLATSGEAAVSAIAEKELEPPVNPKEQEVLGDLWWELAGRETGAFSLRDPMEIRANHWYRSAAERLSGLDRARMEDKLLRAPSRYLSEMPEEATGVGWGKFGKDGDLGYLEPDGDRVVVSGLRALHGLSAHPPTDGYSSIRYRLQGKYRRLEACVGINDTARRRPNPVTFLVLGDGRILWRSTGLQAPGESQRCEVKVQGVRDLELRTSCAGHNAHAQGVWLDPVVRRW